MMKYTTYLAGAIEADKNMTAWRKDVTEKLIGSPILIYDPTEQECGKVGKTPEEYIKYITGLKQGGHWAKFMGEMNKIWLGKLGPSQKDSLFDLFKLLRYRKVIDSNLKEDMAFWGDYEAVVRSDFIIAYMKKGVQTIGTIAEIFLAMLLRIPVYLVIDTPKMETNSSLLYYVLYSGGEVFYTMNECIKHIKETYKD